MICSAAAMASCTGSSAASASGPADRTAGADLRRHRGPRTGREGTAAAGAHAAEESGAKDPRRPSGKAPATRVPVRQVPRVRSHRRSVHGSPCLSSSPLLPEVGGGPCPACVSGAASGNRTTSPSRLTIPAERCGLRVSCEVTSPTGVTPPIVPRLASETLSGEPSAAMSSARRPPACAPAAMPSAEAARPRAPGRHRNRPPALPRSHALTRFREVSFVATTSRMRIPHLQRYAPAHAAVQ